MITTQNSLSTVTPKGLHSPKDFRVPNSQGSTVITTTNPHPYPMLNNNTSSFITDWQLPTMDKWYGNKSYS